MRKVKYPLFIYFFFFASIVYGSVNSTKVINDSWRFVLDNAIQPSDVNWSSSKCILIDLPHTWNNIDVTDDIPDYFRGVGWYQKEINIDIVSGLKYFINFDGANQVVDFYINKQFVGSHIGGYSSFSFEITSFLLPDKPNTFEARVDNKHNENIPPLSGDFNFFGGIYRDVTIQTKSSVFFSGEEFNGNGVYWQTPSVSEKSASVKMFGVVKNSSNKRKEVIIKHIIRNSNLDIVATISNKEILNTDKPTGWESKVIEIANPTLWSLENPYLYIIESTIVDPKTSETLDRTNNYVGFRWFKFDSQTGFFLNGKAIKIIGASRHQDYPGLGNALPKEIHQQDVLALKETGLNFLRIAHYPQDQEVLKLCDRLGILCSVEIPVVNKITETVEFSDICKKMMKEMIWQNYNHPSLIMWSYMNEVMLHPRFEGDSLRQKVYFKHIVELAQELEDIARSLDPFRYTMIPNHGAFDIYNDNGLTKIPMIVGWNLYRGWYEAGFEPLDKFLDRHHAELPDKPLIITEYGAGNDPRLTSDNPERFDCSNDYALRYHQYYLNAINKRPFVNGALIWNLNDFSSNQKIDANPYINNKGIFSFNRVPKESSYFYKANLSKIPFVKIFQPYNAYLSGIEDSCSNDICYKTINVFSNLDSITLYQNDIKVSAKPIVEGYAKFKIPFKNGFNTLKAKANKGKIQLQDNSFVNFDLVPLKPEKSTNKFLEIRISCGDNRFIYDPEIKKIWLPDQKYITGGWGYAGGRRYELNTRRGVKPSSDQSILNTSLDPLLQTQRIGHESYRFDTNPGVYEITLYFALLNGSSKYDALKNQTKVEVEPENTSVSFDILINGEIVLSDFIPGQNGFNRSVAKKFVVNTSNGIVITFKAKQGVPFVNGIIVKKIY